jgi:hypothetical protein
MKRASILWLLASAVRLGAQTVPGPEIGLDVNADVDAVVAQGWPLLIRASVISADGQPVNMSVPGGSWTQALRLTITNAGGAVQNWPVQLVPAASDTLNLSGFSTAEAVWLVAPEATASIAAGVYNLTVTLGTVAGNAATVQLQAEPASLAAEEEASKYLTLSSYAQFQGDLQGAGDAMDTLISRQPDMLMAYTRKADVLAAGGDYASALGLYQQTLNMFQANNPDGTEPLSILTAAMADLTAKLAGQQNEAAGALRNMRAGSPAPVIAPDSIVTARGSRLANIAASASNYTALSLGGTTVTITDSSGVSVAAQLLYVSPGEVRYVAPASLAPGAAKVTVKTADGSIRRGAVTVVK